VAAQKRLLERTAGALREGGRLVYSTCSLEPEEGSELVAAWLRDHRDFVRIDETACFPPQAGTDGIYAAALERSEDRGERV
jgi:16S rRNA (cytosine967-C5)-methyltransferase